MCVHAGLLCTFYYFEILAAYYSGVTQDYGVINYINCLNNELVNYILQYLRGAVEMVGGF